METPSQVSRTKAFGCAITRYAYTSPTLGGTRTTFTVIAPPSPGGDDNSGGGKGDGRPRPLPALYWLSGLTCDDQNFVVKACPAAHVAVASPPLLLIVPDTSPRGAGAPGEGDAEETGTGAGWWLDATAPGWGAYQMESFVVDELPVAVAAALAPRGGTSGGGGGGWTLDPSRRSVAGHSMGGYGALAFATRRRAAWAAVTAFSPVAHPAATRWGDTVFGTYFGTRAVAAAAWAAADPTDAMASGGAPAGDPPPPMVIEQGTADGLWADGALRGDEFAAAAAAAGQPCALRLRRGYDHSLHFVATFLGETVAAHAAALAAAGGGGGGAGGGVGAP